ncbi:excinuclease ABC subunit UvrA [Desulfitobacterium metallireducens]|uniref:UvrABC system protein A n=1 Tax=Desulfitobacterium metallireducens DSM 15288 TaxID=871968 RepID=W0EGP6_9FIRM|nr:excinuclease ABC subunit UvrA [Desulfitobacterium metallireducens]AHF08226.1 excinuclease ABC subunit A [Desulfitobacterium metallireducens DSM 15288]
MTQDFIKVRGARANNLKNISVDIPRDKLVVVTGLSGSGKSSLAFDTIYAEGQRRYVESLSAYARQFLGQVDKPDVDYIEGLSPAISIDQKTTSRNPRSTVGTVTEVYDYLRLLFARVGHPHCPRCGREISQQTVQQMVDQIMTFPVRTKLQILAPLMKGKKGEHIKVFEEARKSGYVRVRVDGETHDLSEELKLEKNKKHSIEVVIDRIVIKPDSEMRLADSLETALKLGEGNVIVHIIDGEEILFSENFACPECGIAIEEISPRLFSFNSPYGACPACTGLGANLEVDVDLILPDRKLSLNEGAVAPWAKSQSNYYPQMLQAVSKALGFTMDTPIDQLNDEQWQELLHGTDQPIQFRYHNIFDQPKIFNAPFEGLIPYFERRYKESSSDYVRTEMEGYMSERPCPVCHGKRLKPEVLAITVGEASIDDVTRMPITEALEFSRHLELSEKEKIIAQQVLKEIRERLGFLVNVGLDYLTLGRAAGTLSGGEAQRIRLATQIGASLMGVLYVLDEPSIGLHQRDNERLLLALEHLRDLGNTLIVVEHDEDTMRTADHIIDIGPGAGAHGGKVVAQGTIEEIKANPDSLTGQYLSGHKKIQVPTERRKPNGKWLVVKGAKENNLKNITVKIPIGLFTCVTGVSGSGKSTLVNEILYKTLASQLNRARLRPGAYKSIEGLEYLDKVIDIDQSPIGRTPRSNPATYTGVFDFIRELFSQTPEAKMRGYARGRFSFNVKGGRCEACRGDGIIKIEMHFLPDVYVPCEVCHGKRYNRETLEVRYKGKSISEVLDMTVEEAVEFFQALPRIARKLQTIKDVGLGYIRLGQPATTLSGGEAQRIKLATELSRRSTGKTIYILDEPTTGLHMADVDTLLQVLHRLVDAGDTVLVIEHNLDVIKTADYLIDLGPEGGNRGGEVLIAGTPEEVVAEESSYTGQFLKRYLN